MKSVNYRPVARGYFKKQGLARTSHQLSWRGRRGAVPGGDKRSQATGIKNAMDLARTVYEGIMASPSTRFRRAESLALARGISGWRGTMRARGVPRLA